MLENLTLAAIVRLWWRGHTETSEEDMSVVSGRHDGISSYYCCLKRVVVLAIEVKNTQVYLTIQIRNLRVILAYSFVYFSCPIILLLILLEQKKNLLLPFHLFLTFVFKSVHPPSCICLLLLKDIVTVPPLPSLDPPPAHPRDPQALCGMPSGQPSLD